MVKRSTQPLRHKRYKGKGFEDILHKGMDIRNKVAQFASLFPPSVREGAADLGAHLIKKGVKNITGGGFMDSFTSGLKKGVMGGDLFKMGNSGLDLTRKLCGFGLKKPKKGVKQKGGMSIPDLAIMKLLGSGIKQK